MIIHILIFSNVKMDVLSQVEKHATYFLQWAISLWYSSATIQNKISLGQYTPNIIEYQIIMQWPRDTHLKSVKLSINLAKYEKQYSPSQTAMIPVTSRPQHHQILLKAPPTHSFWTPSLVTTCHRHIFLHVDWPSKLCDSLYIHHDHLIFQNLHILISHASRW